MNEQAIDREELLDEVEDVTAKLNDILETLKANKELDEMQIAFLKFHKII